MNYNAFTIPVKGYLIDDNIGSSKFVSLTNERREGFPPAVAYVMQNLMDSHDTDRLASMIANGEGTQYENGQISFNERNNARASASYRIRQPNDRERDIQRLVVLFQMTYVGAPMIYYGDEAGMWGSNDPDDRMPMVWPEMQFAPQALLCTDLQVAAPQIVSWFVLRWSLEVTFHEARAHLGVETQRQWSDLAILRTTPALLGLFSLVALFTQHLLAGQPLPARQAAWYTKATPTFAETLALVRQ